MTSSLIEEAARRLEQLRKAGVDVPDLPTLDAPGAAEPSAPSRPSEAVLEALAAEAALPARSREHRAEPSPPAREPAQSRSVTIDLAKLAAAGMVTPDAPRSQIADEYRVIKRPLLTNAQGRAGQRIERGNMIMITSAVPGEGKTFTAINLAMSIAMELDSRVLLVDGDVANPSLAKTLGVHGRSGLLDLLVDPDRRFADVMLRTNVERLSLLPGGGAQRRATELLASEAMIRLIDEMASRYPDRVVVWDTPPVLATTESRVLSSHMGQIVVVVGADRTTQGTLKSALALLEDCPIVMTLLNKATRTDVGSYYGYGGYGADAA